MRDLTLRYLWQDEIANRREGILEVASWDPYKNWDRNANPGGAAMDDLKLSCEVLYSDIDDELGWSLIRQAYEIATRALAENRFEEARPRSLCFPHTRANAFWALGMSQALLGQAGWEESIESALQDRWADTVKHKSLRSDLDEERRFIALRLCLILGRPEEVDRIRKLRKKFKFHTQQYDLMIRLADAVGEGLPIDDPALLEDFDVFFDALRSPRFESDVYFPKGPARLEYGAIRYRYFCSTDGHIDWRAVLAMISR